MKPAPVLSALTALALSACAFSVDVKPTPAANGRKASPYAEVIHKPPTHGIELGRLELQGNNHQAVADCEARCVVEARKLGANAVLVQPEESSWGRGVRCSGIAYWVER